MHIDQGRRPCCVLIGDPVYKSDDPELLMEAATWCIITHKLAHFKKALKIKALVIAEQ